jgi:hypothetical protein
MTQLSVKDRALYVELLRRNRLKNAHTDVSKPTERELAQAAALRNTWFPQQRKFFESTANRRIGFCTRRSGKSVGSVIYFLCTMLEHPKALCLYVAQTSKAARLYVWKELHEYQRMYDLPFEFNENNLWMKHKRGGGTLVLVGADKADEIEKLRGPKWKVAILDESASFGSFMENLILEVIGPALRDENGHLLMIGTAGRKKTGIFYEAAHGLRKRRDGTPVYELHRWSLIDNPYLTDDAKDLDLIMEEEGLSAEDPRFLREYRGIWAAGDSERVFSGYKPETSDYDELPPEHVWKHLLGLDFGWDDENAIAVIAYSETSRVIYCRETWARRNAYSDEIADKIFDFRAKYQVHRYIGDVGGYGKAIQMQLARDYQILVQPAKKHEKLAYIEFLNSAFLRGDMLIYRNDKVSRELLEVSWNDDRTDIKNHEKDNRAMALVYGWRYAKFAGAGRRDLPVRDGEDPMKALAIKQKLDVLRKKDDHEERVKWYLRDSHSGPDGAPNRSLGGPWGDLVTGR